MKLLYGFNGKLETMSTDQVISSLVACEINLRSSNFKYVEEQAFTSQVDEAKTSWSPLFLDEFRKKAREFAAGGVVSLSAIRKALLSLAPLIAAERAKVLDKTSAEIELRQSTAELNLATLFRRAPDTSNALARKYQENGKLFRVKATTTPRNLIVNMNEINAADIFVLAYFVEDINRSILLGYATKNDLIESKKTETGDELPDWKKNSYSIALGGLKSMAQLYKACGLTEIPVGLAMESVPNIGALPIPANKGLQTMVLNQTTEDFDFLSSIGLPSEAAAPLPQKSAPTKTASAPTLPSKQSYDEL